MTTKTYLGQIRKYDRMINNKLADIYRLKSLALSITVEPKTDVVQSSSSHDRMGETVSKIVDMEREVDDMVDKLYERRRRIIEQIDMMKDDDYCDVLTARFVLCMSFDDIPQEICMSRRKVFYVYDKALKEFDRIYGHEYKNL